MKDNTVSNKYGLPQVQNRPQIKAEKNLCLNGEEGRQIIKSETKLTLKTHEKTFTRLADMQWISSSFLPLGCWRLTTTS